MSWLPSRMRYSALVAALVLFTIGGIFFSRGHMNDTAPLSEWQAGVLLWEETIEDVGAEEAYALLASRIEEETIQVQHTEAHIFGEALYRIEGNEGLAVCKDQFSYGCFHQFIGVAIAEHGVSVIPLLSTACDRALGQRARTCTHSIGHGIVSHLGYTLDSLQKSLAICHGLPGTAHILGCDRGAFMEFNFQTMQGEGMQLRKPVEGDMQYPCTAVLNDRDRRSCMYSQPQWWRTYYKNYGESDEVIYRRLGKLCLQQDGLRDVCFGGVGTSIAWDLDEDPKYEASLCEATSPHGHDQAICKMNAAYWLRKILDATPESAYAAADVCTGLSGQDRDICLSYAHGSEGALPLYD